MNWRRTLTLSSAALAISLTYSQPSKADGLTGREFSQRSVQGQDGYISTAVVMAAFIAGQMQPAFSDCITRWYFDDPRGQDAKNANLREVIAQYPDFHPSATVLVLMQKACGRFDSQ